MAPALLKVWKVKGGGGGGGGGGKDNLFEIFFKYFLATASVRGTNLELRCRTNIGGKWKHANHFVYGCDRTQMWQ